MVRRRTPRAVKRERQAARGDPVLDCYLIALSKGSACDGTSGEVSLFQVVVNARHLLTEFGRSASYSMLFFLRSEEVHYKAEVRTLWVAHAPDAPNEPAEDPSTISVTTRYMQLRRTLTHLPQAPGEYDLVLDWRKCGEKTWRRASSRFPIVFEEKT